MKIEIKNRRSGSTIYVAEYVTSRREAILRTITAGADLSDADLSGADLSGADLSSARLARANLHSANLSNAILARADLREACLCYANLGGATFARAALCEACLCYANLGGTSLCYADLSGADLSGAKLFGGRLSGANLSATTFGDLSLLIPTVAQLDAHVLAAVTAEGGALDMGLWHTTSPSTPVCGSTHCRAGWAIHLAGEAGYTLERLVGPSAAGALIYAKSTGRPVPSFHACNEDAFEDIKRCAALDTNA